MAGMKALICLAFAGSIGMTFLVLSCALPSFGVWWPFFVLIFYILSPIPIVISRRYQDEVNSSNACKEVAVFLTTGIVISSFGLPIILARAAVIQWGACVLTMAGNIVVFLTILGFFLAFDNDDVEYSMW